MFFCLFWRNNKADDVLEGEPDDKGGLCHLEEVALLVMVLIVCVLGGWVFRNRIKTEADLEGWDGGEDKESNGGDQEEGTDNHQHLRRNTQGFTIIHKMRTFRISSVTFPSWSQNQFFTPLSPLESLHHFSDTLAAVEESGSSRSRQIFLRKVAHHRPAKWFSWST